MRFFVPDASVPDASVFELEDGKVGDEVFIGSCILTIILSTISVTTNTLLIVGVCTINYNFIYPTLIWIPTLFIINIVGLVVFVLLGISDADATILIDIFVQLGIVSLCWLCVHSYWQQVIVSNLERFILGLKTWKGFFIGSGKVFVGLKNLERVFYWVWKGCFQA